MEVYDYREKKTLTVYPRIRHKSTMFIADLITLRISLSLNQNMHLLKHYSFPLEMISAADWNFTRKEI